MAERASSLPPPVTKVYEAPGTASSRGSSRRATQWCIAGSCVEPLKYSSVESSSTRDELSGTACSASSRPPVGTPPCVPHQRTAECATTWSSLPPVNSSASWMVFSAWPGSREELMATSFSGEPSSSFSCSRRDGNRLRPDRPGPAASGRPSRRLSWTTSLRRASLVNDLAVWAKADSARRLATKGTLSRNFEERTGNTLITPTTTRIRVESPTGDLKEVLERPSHPERVAFELGQGRRGGTTSRERVGHAVARPSSLGHLAHASKLGEEALGEPGERVLVELEVEVTVSDLVGRHRKLRGGPGLDGELEPGRLDNERLAVRAAHVLLAEFERGPHSKLRAEGLVDVVLWRFPPPRHPLAVNLHHHLAKAALAARDVEHGYAVGLQRELPKPLRVLLARRQESQRHRHGRGRFVCREAAHLREEQVAHLLLGPLSLRSLLRRPLRLIGLFRNGHKLRLLLLPLPTVLGARAVLRGGGGHDARDARLILAELVGGHQPVDAALERSARLALAAAATALAARRRAACQRAAARAARSELLGRVQAARDAVLALRVLRRASL
eukprot:scaffold35185_cov62-Phaeocystis_antarctica.AAC.5